MALLSRVKLPGIAHKSPGITFPGLFYFEFWNADCGLLNTHMLQQLIIQLAGSATAPHSQVALMVRGAHKLCDLFFNTAGQRTLLRAVMGRHI